MADSTAKSAARTALAEIMKGVSAAARGKTPTVEMTPGRISENVEFVQGPERFTDNQLLMINDMLRKGYSVPEVGPFDDVNVKNMMAFPGQLAQWSPPRALNPGPSSADRMASMIAPTLDNNGWMSEAPEGNNLNTLTLDANALLGDWSPSYPRRGGFDVRSDRFRPGYRLPK